MGIVGICIDCEFRKDKECTHKYHKEELLENYGYWCYEYKKGT